MPKFQLLTLGNPKLLKSKNHGYLSFVLHLAPANLSGHEVCKNRTKQCTALCLNTAGRGGMIGTSVGDMIQAARVRRTQWFFSSRESFMSALIDDIERGIAYAYKNGFKPCFRLNGTSDILWESIPAVKTVNIFALYPEIQFYDYTKAPYAKRAHDIPNYTLVFSLAETHANRLNALDWINHGRNVAAVFDVGKNQPLPERYTIALPKNIWSMCLPVIDGDISDLRFLDAKGVIVGLRAKGKAAKDTRNGFVIQI